MSTSPRDAVISRPGRSVYLSNTCMFILYTTAKQSVIIGRYHLSELIDLCQLARVLLTFLSSLKKSVLAKIRLLERTANTVSIYLLVVYS